jgi:4-amino-4-deoxy-L-arabinose transferase-like glycosyltransferase
VARGVGLGAIVSLVLAYAVLVQGGGWNQNSHYALIRAFDAGTAVIDRTRYETGVPVTGDIAVYRGHTYSQKAPGLAFVSMPAYFVMKAVGKARVVDHAAGQLWFLGLWGVVLPALVLLLLVRKLANELEPGLGTIAALILGLATLVLPFADQFFSHVLSALLVFAAFAVLWYERRGPPRLGYVAAAGLLAGYSVTTEFPNAMVLGILGLFTLARSGWPRRALAYSAGAIAGLAPLLAYNAWAFGSPFHISYENTVGFGTSRTLFFSGPSFRRLVEVLFAPTGILRTTPVLGLAVVGIVLLYRRGRRFEALAVTAVALAFLALESCYTFAFGGAAPGPRYVIPMLPFLALPLAVAGRRMPLTTLVLAGVSAVEMVAATITHPASYSQTSADWFHRLGTHDFTATVLAFFGHAWRDDLDRLSSAHWYPLLLFFVPVALALALAAAERPPFSPSHRDALRAGACLLGWLVLQHEGPKLLGNNTPVLSQWAPILVLSLAAVLITTAAALPLLLRPPRH